MPGAVFSVSVTTRKSRKGEVDGRDYFFISEKKFRRMVSGGQLAEWARVHGHYYGTPKKQLRDAVSSGRDIVLDIDVQGGRKIRKQYLSGVFIFILPPSLKALEHRLRNRGQDDEQTIRVRLENARKEISYITDYDYLVINDKLNEAVEQARSIITAEHARISRLKNEISGFKKAQAGNA